SGSEWAGEIPTRAGANTLTAVALLGNGAEATASVTVTASEPEPLVTLHADPGAGLVPLTVTWRVASRAPRPLVRFELDPTGGGTYGAPSASLDSTESVYPTAGPMLPTLRATDDQGQ